LARRLPLDLVANLRRLRPQARGGRIVEEFDMPNTELPTWREYAARLTPEEIEILERCDRNPNHPNGLEGHRRGQIATAYMYVMERRSPWWRRWLT
jgi:hypothetical protein